VAKNVSYKIILKNVSTPANEIRFLRQINIYQSSIIILSKIYYHKPPSEGWFKNGIHGLLRRADD